MAKPTVQLTMDLVVADARRDAHVAFLKGILKTREPEEEFEALLEAFNAHVEFDKNASDVDKEVVDGFMKLRVRQITIDAKPRQPRRKRGEAAATSAAAAASPPAPNGEAPHRRGRRPEVQ